MTAPPAAAAQPARLWALIPCAGSGSRAGTVSPKQYEILAGRPMVLHTLAAFAGVTRLRGSFVVVAPGDSFLKDRLQPHEVLLPCGGPSRAASVGNGLAAMLEQGAASDDWVLVHDAARCLVTPELIDRLIDGCLQDGVGGLLAQPVSDTLKRAQDGRVVATPNRIHHWLAQTPQMFRIAALQDALTAAGDAVTDEASAMEAAGHAPILVRGSALNFKVTWPEDFVLARAVLAARAEAARKVA